MKKQGQTTDKGTTKNRKADNQTIKKRTDRKLERKTALYSNYNLMFKKPSYSTYFQGVFSNFHNILTIQNGTQDLQGTQYKVKIFKTLYDLKNNSHTEKK